MKRLKPAGGCIRGLMSLKQIGMVCFAFLFSIFSTNLFATGINANATSASCDNPTLGTYSGTSNLQANWQANKINLTWYSDDTQITSVQDAATSCNYDGTLSVPSTPPTKTGYTFNGWKVRGLPEGYTRLQYIQSSGTQYIDTGVQSYSDTFFNMEVLFVNRGNGYRFFGNSSTLLGYSSSSNSSFFVNNISTAISFVASTLFNTKMTIRYKGTTININGTDYTCSQASANSSNLYINARADSLSTRVASGKWYSV